MKHLAVAASTRIFDGRLGEERSLERVVALELQAREIRDMALQRADPALLRDDDGHRLALDHRLGEIGDRRRRGAAPKVVRRLPSFVSGPNFFLTSRISTAIIFHCFFSLASEQASIVRLLLGQRRPAPCAAPFPRGGAGFAGACRECTFGLHLGQR